MNKPKERQNPPTRPRTAALSLRGVNGTAMTSEETRVPFYADADSPTCAAQVRGTTPLGALSLNWTEKELPERERTKHVHRLHPYLGKYIPQLVEVFIRKFLSPGETVLDPFCGSGTTLVQANELNVHSIGCDISAFNVLLSGVKTAQYDIATLKREAADILDRAARLTNQQACGNQTALFCDGELSTPVQGEANDYLNTWFAPQALAELVAFRSLIDQYQHQDFLKVVLSRAARSARQTTHFDLDFPKAPTTQPYQCYKHGRVCAPTKTAFKFLARYCTDAVRRVEEFSRLRSSASVRCIHADSRLVDDLPPIDAVITSPPYVGLIDYHEQHRYAYELLALDNNRNCEIGPAFRGQSRTAKKAYCADMAAVFRKTVSKLRTGGVLVVVAADKHSLYPSILGGLGLVSEATLLRHVNRRTGRRAGEFYESIFVLTKR